MISGLDMKHIITITFLLLSIVFAIIVELKIRKGKINRADTYSYAQVLRMGVRSSFFAIIISLIVYLFSNSLEVTITLGIFFLSCIVAGCLYGLFLEYQVKRRR